MSDPTTDLPTVDEPLRLTGEQLRLEYIPLAAVRKWYRNPKQHDIGAIVTSIEKYGFVDPPKFDPSLNDGEGGLVYGNGRDEALEWMAAQRHAVPRGIATDPTGAWYLPVIFGVDAKSQAVAMALAIDHNNLTMAGGDLTAVDMARVWTPAYLDILREAQAAGEMPVTVDHNDLALLIEQAAQDDETGDELPSDGSLLALTNVTIDPPRYDVETGDIWELGGHILICIDVLTGWPLWAGELTGEQTIFIPYAGPYAPLTIKAEQHRMVLVQPDPYIAGHILDRYEEIHGADSITKR